MLLQEFTLKKLQKYRKIKILFIINYLDKILLYAFGGHERFDILLQLVCLTYDASKRYSIYSIDKEYSYTRMNETAIK